MLFLVRGHWARPFKCVFFLNFIRRIERVRYIRDRPEPRRLRRLTRHWFRPVLTLKIDPNQLSDRKRTSGYLSPIPRNETEIVSLIFKLRTRTLITPLLYVCRHLPGLQNWGRLQVNTLEAFFRLKCQRVISTCKLKQSKSVTRIINNLKHRQRRATANWTRSPRIQLRKIKLHFPFKSGRLKQIAKKFEKREVNLKSRFCCCRVHPF